MQDLHPSQLSNFVNVIMGIIERSKAWESSKLPSKWAIPKAATL